MVRADIVSEMKCNPLNVFIGRNPEKDTLLNEYAFSLQNIDLYENLCDHTFPLDCFDVINKLRDSQRKLGGFMLISTDNAIIIDDFLPTEIWMVTKDSIHRPFVTNERLVNMLKYMNPGEILLNCEESDLLP